MTKKTKKTDLERREIDDFQKHLNEYLKLFNVTDAALGEQLGVSRTQICNIKAGRCKMTKAQYIAIMVILSGIEETVGVVFGLSVDTARKYDAYPA